MARIELAKLSDIKKNTNFIIAPSDALNKENADLVLTGIDDQIAIMDAIESLHESRESTDMSIRIDFLGGTIQFYEALSIPEYYDNICLYGNGTRIVGNTQTMPASLIINGSNNIKISGFIIENEGVYCIQNNGGNCCIENNIIKNSINGIWNNGDYCYIINNYCDAFEAGIINSGQNSFICFNRCFSTSTIGIINSGYACIINNNEAVGVMRSLSNEGTECVITNNFCLNAALFVADNANYCIIIGNNCFDSGISVKSGTVKPSTLSAMADMNTGSIIFRP